MSRPGTICDLSEHIGHESAAVGVLATLLDNSTTVGDPDELLDDQAWALLGATKCRPEEAAFIICLADRQPDFAPLLGTLESPELSATVLLSCAGVGEGGATYALNGPGINGRTTLQISGVDHAWFSKRQEWTDHYPLGVDLIFADRSRVAALPRTTRVEAIEA